MSVLLEVSDISAGYAESIVLHDVSLNVQEGTVTALLGRNGVGKTTTLRTIVGLLEPREGTVHFDGEDITGLSPHEIYARGIGMVPEDRRIFPKLTVEENLQVPIMEDATGEWEIEELYEFFPKLAELRESEGRALSGGELQMLSIARALRPDPTLLLLDEPSEGLAPQIVQDVAEIIEDISETGTTVVLVEQNIKLALELSDYAYVMDMGEIVFDGEARELAADEELVQRHLGVEQETSI